MEGELLKNANFTKAFSVTYPLAGVKMRNTAGKAARIPIVFAHRYFIPAFLRRIIASAPLRTAIPACSAFL